MAGPQRQRLIVVRERLVMPAHGGHQGAALMQSIDVARRVRQHALIAGQRLHIAAEMLERVAAVVMQRGSIAGRHRQRLIEAFERFLVPLQSIQNDAQIGEHIGRGRPHLQRSSHQPKRFGRAALLMLEHAAEV